MRLIPYFHNRHSEQSRGCNAAAEGGEARLSIPLPNSPVTSRDVSTLDMTGGRTLQSNCTLHIIQDRSDGFQRFHALNNCVGIFQAVPCDRANYTTALGNFLE